MSNVNKGLEEYPLGFTADDAYKKSEEANRAKMAAVDKFVNSSISMGMLTNFIGRKIEEAVNRADFQLVIAPEMLQDFTAPYNVLSETIILICNKQNFMSRKRVDGTIVVNWKSPRETIKTHTKEKKPFQFSKPEELK